MLLSTLFRASSLLLIASALSACGSGAAPASAPPEEGSVPFDEMSKGQKLEHMKRVVAPKMATVFARSPEEDGDEFSCATCHGEAASTGDFSMPSKELPLDDEEIEEHPLMSKFMANEVVSEMKVLLRDDDFGCFDCHVHSDD